MILSQTRGKAMDNKISFIFLLIIAIVKLSAQSATEIAKIAINSTVSIVALDQTSQPLGYGSGFIIDDELVATNVHVIEGCNSGYVIRNGEQKKYVISGYVAIDKINDLVILKVVGLIGPKLNLGTEVFPEIGEKIYAVGNPKGLNGTFSEGIISGIRDKANNQVLQITAPISPGSSGGPVLNSNGAVIGVAFASFSSGQNLNFAIPVKYLTLLKSNTGTVVSLSSVKVIPNKESSGSLNSEINEGVTIRNLILNSKRIGLSIKNNLGYTVSDIKILFLAYDSSNEIVDYTEQIFFTKSTGGIKAYLAKSIDCVDYRAPYISTNFARTVKARILDFNIIEE